MSSAFPRLFGITATALALASAAGCTGVEDGVREDEWPQVLGPNGDGRISLPIRTEWPADGPPVLWRKPVGEGFAAVSVADDTAFLFHRLEDEEIVEALDPATGETRWQTAHPTVYRDEYGWDDGPRTSPTVRNGVVFTAGAERFIQGLDARTGERLWGFDASERYKARRSPYGNGAQPFWVDDKIVLNIGGEKAGIVALDAATGETVWSATDHEASYAPPLLAEVNEQRHLLFFTREGLVDLDPASGEVRRFFAWRSRARASVNASAPVQVGNRIFLTAAYAVGAAMLEFTPDGFSPVWTGKSRLSSQYVTSIHHEGVIYGMHLRQPINPYLRAISAETGEILWSRRGQGTGTLLLAADTLIFMRETGELTLIESTGEEYRELAEHRILEGVVRAYPALAGGVLYMRDDSELIAVDLRPTS